MNHEGRAESAAFVFFIARLECGAALRQWTTGLQPGLPARQNTNAYMSA